MLFPDTPVGATKAFFAQAEGFLVYASPSWEQQWSRKDAWFYHKVSIVLHQNWLTKAWLGQWVIVINQNEGEGTAHKKTKEEAFTAIKEEAMAWLESTYHDTRNEKGEGRSE